MATPDPQALIRTGDLQGALEAVKGQVRKDPAEVRHRILLFQLMSITGDWDRALNQLNVMGDLDAKTLAMVQAYRETLRCEALRADVFAGRRTPLIFGEPEEWMAGMLHALELEASGHSAQAEQARAAALDQAQATTGRIDGQAFTWVADADARIGPFLEAIVAGRYYWIPFSRLRRVQVEAPADLRDLVWTPVHLTFANGGDSVAFIPTRYPGSEAHEDPRVQLARLTDWRSLGTEGASGSAGIGQRMLATDEADHPLLEVRVIELDTEDDLTTQTPGGSQLDAELASRAGAISGPQQGESDG